MHSNKINTKIEGSNVLDLYSGIGSFGIECFSRKAKKVTFVEENNNIIKVLKQNLNLLVEDEKANEETLGELFSYFMLETIMIGTISGVNPFDQNAVEQVKVLTQKELSKRIYQK